METSPNASPSAAANPVSSAAGTADKGSGSGHALRYGWSKGEVYLYRLKIESQLGKIKEEVNGVVTYTVKSVAADGVAELSVLEVLNRSRIGEPVEASVPIRLAARPSYHGRSLPPSLYRRGSGYAAEAPNSLKVDHYGRVLSVEGGGDLPYFLGRIAHLAMETLSPLGEKRWTVSTDAAFSLIREDWLPPSLLATGRKTHLPATEKITYAVTGSNRKLVDVAKSFEMVSSAEVEGKPCVAMTGEGKLAFDRQRGVFASSNMKLRLAVREEGVAVERTTTLSYELASEAEMAKMKAEREKNLEASKQRHAEIERPIDAKNVDKLLADLRSGDTMKSSTALSRLTRRQAHEPNRELTRGLESLTKNANPRTRQLAAEALQYWGTKESIPALLTLLDDADRQVRHDAIRALGHLKATQAIDRLIRLWPNEYGVTEALKAMGQAAEPAVLQQLAHGNDRVGMQACQVLQEIGTAKCIPALEKAQASGGVTGSSAQIALRVIKTRLGK